MTLLKKVMHNTAGFDSQVFLCFCCCELVCNIVIKYYYKQIYIGFW